MGSEKNISFFFFYLSHSLICSIQSAQAHSLHNSRPPALKKRTYVPITPPARPNTRTQTTDEALCVLLDHRLRRRFYFNDAADVDRHRRISLRECGSRPCWMAAAAAAATGNADGSKKTNAAASAAAAAEEVWFGFFTVLNSILYNRINIIIAKIAHFSKIETAPKGMMYVPSHHFSVKHLFDLLQKLRHLFRPEFPTKI